MERWLSGRKRLTANEVGLKLPRGFESRPLRIYNVSLDDLRESLADDERYKKWVNFYIDQNEFEYLTKTSPEDQWKNLVAQSEAIWPAFLEEILKYADEEKPVIFESVNILPHLARRDLDMSGIVLIGHSAAETLERNKKEPRWGETEELQKLEAETFFNVERPRYKAEAEKNNYPVFETPDEAWETAVSLLMNS